MNKTKIEIFKKLFRDVSQNVDGAKELIKQ